MLDTLRKGAAGWVAKIFLSILVLSFAVWGIADIFRVGGSTTAAATVGKDEITVEQFRQAYTNEIRRIGQQAKRAITPEQARMAGIGERVLGNLVNEAAMDARGRTLGLSVSEEEIAREITGDEVFRGLDGKFDRANFQEVLRQNNLREADYIGLQRAFTTRRHLAESLSANVAAPAALREALHAYTTESRSIAYLSVAPEAPGSVPAPSADLLKAFFEERKGSFKAPEYRTIALISLDPVARAASRATPDAELRTYYDANKTSYVTAEKRSIQQITFPTAEEARMASGEIKGGKTFDQLMTDRRVAAQDAELGTLTKAELFDSKIAAAAFALQADAVSEPVEGAYSTALLRVTAIQPERVRSFEEARAEIRKTVAEQAAKAEVLALHDKIDEARLGGATLDEIAKAQNVPVRVIEAVDATGRTPAGAKIGDLPQSQRLLEESFRAEIGAENEPVTSGDAFVWYEVRGSTPSRDRSFDEARAAVEARWREDEARKRLNARTDALLAELKGGKTIEQVASAHTLEVEQAETTRTGGAPAVTAAQANAVFAAPVEGFGATGANDAGVRLVFRVVAENTRPFDPAAPDGSGTAGRLAENIGNDIISSFVSKLRDDLGTRFNQQAIAQVVGGGES